MGFTVKHEEKVDAFRTSYEGSGYSGAGPVRVVIHRNVTLSDDGHDVLDTSVGSISVEHPAGSRVSLSGMSLENAASLAYALLEAVGLAQGEPAEGRPVAAVMRADPEGRAPDRWIVQIDTETGTGKVTVYLNDSEEPLYEGDPERE